MRPFFIFFYRKKRTVRPRPGSDGRDVTSHNQTVESGRTDHATLPVLRESNNTMVATWVSAGNQTEGEKTCTIYVPKT